MRVLLPCGWDVEVVEGSNEEVPPLRLPLDDDLGCPPLRLDLVLVLEGGWGVRWVEWEVREENGSSQAWRQHLRRKRARRASTPLRTPNSEPQEEPGERGEPSLSLGESWGPGRRAELVYWFLSQQRDGIPQPEIQIQSSMKHSLHIRRIRDIIHACIMYY